MRLHAWCRLRRFSVQNRVFLSALLATSTLCVTAHSTQAQHGIYRSPPAHATVLFDGGPCHQFVSATGGPIDWPIVEGTLVSTPNGRRSNNLVSRVHFRDAVIHVEFLIPEGGDGNSGVFLQGKYELQILSPARRTDDGTGDAGAVYGLYRPRVHAARGPGHWQAYDIRFVAPRYNSHGNICREGRISAWLNGILIHERVSIGGRDSDYNPYTYDVTPYVARIADGQHATSCGPLILQDHDSPVRFRNIWLVPLDGCEIYDGGKNLNSPPVESEQIDWRAKDLIPSCRATWYWPHVRHVLPVGRDNAGLRSWGRRSCCLGCQTN